MFKIDFSQLTGSVILGVLLVLGCGQNGDEEKNENTEKMQQEQISDISEAELQQFMTVSQQIQTINQEVQQEMAKVVQDEELGVQRFNEIQRAQMNPEQQVDATNEEMKKYEKSVQQFKEIQVDAQQRMEKKISDEGLTVERYQEIVKAIQSDPEVQNQFREMQPGQSQ